MKRGLQSRHLLENPFTKPCWTAETAHPTANVRVSGSARIAKTRNLDLAALPTSPHLPAPSLPSAHFGPLAVADMVGSRWSHNACRLQQATRDLYKYSVQQHIICAIAKSQSEKGPVVRHISKHKSWRHGRAHRRPGPVNVIVQAQLAVFSPSLTTHILTPSGR